MSEYKHEVAFKLLKFHCSSCNTEEWIWNSGDHGLTNEVNCTHCQHPMVLRTNPFKEGLQIPDLTPLGIRWFVTETKELYTKRIKQQIKDMEDNLFQGTTRKIVEKSLIDAYIPDKVYLVDPLTLNFEEQIEILLNTD